MILAHFPQAVHPSKSASHIHHRIIPRQKWYYQRAGEPQRLETVGEACEVTQTRAAFDPSFHSGQALSESAAAIGFLDLAVQEVERHLPTEFARSPIGDPLTEMGREGIEVEVEAVTGNDWQSPLYRASSPMSLSE